MTRVYELVIICIVYRDTYIINNKIYKSVERNKLNGLALAANITVVSAYLHIIRVYLVHYKSCMLRCAGAYIYFVYASAVYSQ